MDLFWYLIKKAKYCEVFDGTFPCFYIRWCVYQLLLLKPEAQAQVGKPKLFINCFRNPTSTCDTESWRKHNSGAPNGWLYPSIHPAFRCQTQCAGKVLPHSNLGRQETPWKYVHHIDTSNFNGLAAPAARVYRTPIEAWRWTLTQQTVIQNWINLVHYTHPSNTTSMTQRQETQMRTMLATEYTWRSRSWRCRSASALHTGEQYSRIGRTNTK